MSSTPHSFAPSFPTLHDLTFPELRLAVGRWLVIICFVWPFFNYNLIIPGNTVEINFLFVFLAALTLPEVFLQDPRSLLLALPAFAAALIGGSATAPLRLAIGIIPLHFLFNLTRTLRARGEEILPPNLAYRAMQVFVLFTVVQTIQFYYYHVIPAFISNVMVAIVPRYWTVPYDDFGVHGVQGWASEPSCAALTCIAFALVAIRERPDRRLKVLFWFALLLMFNKSIYATVLAVLLVFGCVMTLRHKFYALLAFIPSCALAAVYMAYSGRVATLRTNIIVDGLTSESNHELARFAQIFSPLQQFPHIYKPVILYGSWVMEPMGLLPLVVGYGNIFGILWLIYMVRHNLPFSRVTQLPLALIALLVLGMMAPPDLICSIVALAVFIVPLSRGVAPKDSSHVPEKFTPLPALLEAR